MILHDFYMKNDLFSNRVVLVGYTVVLGERISLHCVQVKVLFSLLVNRNMIPMSICASISTFRVSIKRSGPSPFISLNIHV